MTDCGKDLVVAVLSIVMKTMPVNFKVVKKKRHLTVCYVSIRVLPYMFGEIHSNGFSPGHD